MNKRYEKVKVEYKDGTEQEIDYPTPDEVKRLNDEAMKIAEAACEEMGVDPITGLPKGNDDD